MSTAFRHQVSRVLRDLTRCAEASDEILGLAVVGSWARGEAGIRSDLDVVILGDVATLMSSQPWAEVTSGAELVGSRAFGSVVERRFRFPSGLVLELGVAPREWASTRPIDPGTRRVASDGMRVLSDPNGLLQGLARAL